MSYPTVHLNGTGRDELLAQAMHALDTLKAAQEAMRGAAPNGRDYYVQGPGVYVEARRAYEARLYALGELISYYHGLALDIDNQG